MATPNVSLFVTFTVRPEDAAAMEDALARMAALVKEREPGCLVWRPSRSREDPNRFRLYEQYVDDAALDAHRAAPHFQELILGIVRNLAVSREADTCEVFAG